MMGNFAICQPKVAKQELNTDTNINMDNYESCRRIFAHPQNSAPLATKHFFLYQNVLETWESRSVGQYFFIFFLNNELLNS